VFGVRSPYRVCLLGAHSDHQLGNALAWATDKRVSIHATRCDERSSAAESGPEDGFMRAVLSVHGDSGICSTSQEKEGSTITVTLSTGGHGAASESDMLVLHSAMERRCFSAYFIAAVLALRSRGFRCEAPCVDLKISGELPPGGLSSSAAVGVAYLLALLALHGYTYVRDGDSAGPDEVDQATLVELDVAIEREFLGVKNGALDPASICFSRAQSLLHVVTRHLTDSSLLQWPIESGRPPPCIVAVYSGVVAASGGSLKHTGFNSRTDECIAAASQLFAHAREKERQPEGLLLGDLTHDEFEAHVQKLPETLRRRATHFFTEQERVRSGIRRWGEGDLEALGELIRASGMSSIEQYCCGCPEMNEIVAILNADTECLGARASGGGWRGFVVGLVSDGEKAARVGARCVQVYRSLPGVSDSCKQKAHFVILQSGDGARVCERSVHEFE